MTRASGVRAICGLLCLAPLTLFAESAASPAPAQFAELRAGDSLAAALATLNARGHRVVYSSALVRPHMSLTAVPASQDIEPLLREILAPWNLRAVRTPQGEWLVTGAGPGTAIATAAGEQTPEDLGEIDVTATRLLIAVPGASEMFLDREDVERLPHLADDAMRMLKVLPGVSGGDFSAALNVRGGRREETLLTIDGAEIHNAFHFRDIDGALSVLDTNLVDGIDFITGGITADVGDYMSGVVGLETRRPGVDDEYRSGVGISFVSAYGRTSGRFAQDRGSWLVSARRGFLDVLTAELVPEDERLRPRYTDVFAATDFDFSADTRVGARLLLSDDDLTFETDDEVDDIESEGGGRSAHLWFTLDHAFGDALQSRTLLSAATVNQTRDAHGTDEERSSTVSADNDFRFLDLRQDWTWAFDQRHLPRWGFNVGEQRGDYDYVFTNLITDRLVSPVPIETAYATRMSVKMRKLGLYAAWRSRIGERFTVEAGGRWDSYRYDPGEQYDAVSPRINLVYQYDADHQFRGSWGILHQPQAANELQVEDNVTTFFEPERVQQVALGYQWRFAPGYTLRVDVYDKTYDNLRARYENALDPVELIPEGATDRIRIAAREARARGVELTVRRDVESGFAGWASLAFARTEDFENGAWYPRSWEQRQSLSFGTSWTGARWNVSFAGLLHDGTPTTYIGVRSTPLPDGSYAVEGVVGPRNGERFDPYARIDLRATREVPVSTGRLSFYLEVTNLLDMQNECCVADYDLEQRGNSAPYLQVDTSYWLPMLPSFGVHWEF